MIIIIKSAFNQKVITLKFAIKFKNQKIQNTYDT